jgi:hypothetical protein
MQFFFGAFKMRIVYLNKNGQLRKANERLPTAHQENLEYLERHHELHQQVLEKIHQRIDQFVNVMRSEGDAYLNSGEVAVSVCTALQLDQSNFNHGLVGSALNVELGHREEPFTVIASKGEDQTWFDYFYLRQSQ